MSKIYTHTPLDLYIGLSSTAPNPDGTNITEPIAGNYSRVALGGLSEPINGKVSNLTDLSFPISTAIWFDSGSPVKYYVIFDSGSANAHYLSSGEFALPREICDGIQIKLISGSINITLSDSSGSVV